MGFFYSVVRHQQMNQARTYLQTIRLPLIVSGTLSVLITVFSYQASPEVLQLFSSVPEYFFEAPRVMVVWWAGWLAGAHYGSRIAGSGFAGVLVFFVDHVLVTGGTYLALAQFDNTFPYYQAFAGVFASFVMFAALYFILGAVAGLIGRRATRGSAHVA